jgi:hypothetical protein
MLAKLLRALAKIGCNVTENIVSSSLILANLRDRIDL